MTWGQDEGPNGRGTPPPGADAWDSGARSVLEGLATYDLRDVYRALHPRAKALSWFWRDGGKGGGKPVGRRVDHIFANASLHATTCRYAHDVRDDELSDHSAILAEFNPGAAESSTAPAPGLR